MALRLGNILLECYHHRSQIMIYLWNTMTESHGRLCKFKDLCLRRELKLSNRDHGRQGDGSGRWASAESRIHGRHFTGQDMLSGLKK